MLFPGILADGSLIATAASIRTSLGLGIADNPTFANLTASTLTTSGNVLIGTATDELSRLKVVGINGSSMGSRVATFLDNNTQIGVNVLIGWTGGAANAKYKSITVDSVGLGFGSMVDTLTTVPTYHWIIRNSTGHLLAGNGTQLIQWGLTSSFPALKRSSTTLQCRLADDSDHAPFECSAETLKGVSSTALRERAAWSAGVIDNTDATRKYRSIHSAYDTAAREYARGWGDGSAGRIAVAAPPSAPTDAHLANSQISPYVDEVGHSILFKVKYSDGTIKTFTGALT